MNKTEIQSLVDVKSVCDSITEKFLDTLFSYLIQEGPRNLLNYALSLHSFSESAPLLNLSKDIETNEARLRGIFFDYIKEYSNQKLDHDELDEKKTNQKMVLELLDEEVLDEWLKIKSIITSVESSVGGKLNINLQKYDFICQLIGSNEKKSFSPIVIYKSIQSVFLEYDLSVSVKFNIYNTVKDGLITFYPNIISELEKSLQDYDLESHNKNTFTPVISKKNKNRDQSVNFLKEGYEDIQDEVSGIDGSISPSKYDQLNDIDQNLHNTELQSLLSMLNLQRGNMQNIGVNKSSVTEQVQKSLLSSKNSLQLLSQLSSASNIDEHEVAFRQSLNINKPANNLTHDQSVNINDLIEGLQYVLKENESFLGTGTRLKPSNKVEEFLVGKKGAKSSIPIEYKETIDGAAYLFSKAKSEYKEKSDIKNLLKRLERPILKLMLTDSEFMTSPQHPARDVVNLIDECSMATNVNEQITDKRLLKFLALQVDEIDSKFTTDPDVFVRVRDKLLKVIIPIRRARKNRMFKAQQKFQSQQLVFNAKTRIDAFLESGLPGSERPRVLNEVLEKGWYQYLILQQLSNDQVKKSESTSVMELLINLLLGEVKLGEKDINSIIEEIINGFKAIGSDTHVLYSMRAYISDELKKPISEIEWINIPIKQPEPLVTPIFKSMQTLDPGSWWQFNVASKWQTRQLVWRSKNGQHLGFVNRSATETIMLSLKTFAEDFKNETIRDYPQQNLPLMERSEHGLFDESYNEMIHNALHDPITDLLNKKGIISKINQVASMSGLDTCHSICQIIFDQIDVVNLNCGISAGEKLIARLSSALGETLINNQSLAQISSDTFLIFLPNINKVDAKILSNQIISNLSNFRFEHEREIYSIGLSIGFLEFSPALLNVVELLSKVDSACRAAKLQGRNTVVEYSEEDLYLQAQQAMKDWAGRIDRILENDGLYLRCQRVEPIDPTSGLEAYYEILLGIKDVTDSSNEENKYRQISPSHFFPALELWKRSFEVDLWVLHSVFDWIRTNENLFLDISGFAINLSAQSLNNLEVLNFLRNELSKGDLPNSKITFEITETAAIESYGKAQEFMDEIKKLGCLFSLDDFGAGFSSYSHLKNLNTSTLKIDGSFVKDIVESSTDRMMVRSMNELGKFLGMKTVAEFVENEDILEILKEIGVDYAQGYALHKPIPISQLEQELSSRSTHSKTY